MYDFKIGDRVIVSNWRGDEQYGQGWVGTVTEIGLYIRVMFDNSAKRRTQSSLVSNGELSPYVEPKAAAIAGGLQPHSVGDLYPLAVVSYEGGGKVVHFIENLQTGTVLLSSPGSEYPKPFYSMDKAFEALTAADLKLFAPGRPHYLASNAAWVLYKPTNPVRVVRLHNMLHRNESQ